MSTKRPRSPSDNERPATASKRLHNDVRLRDESAAPRQLLSHEDYDIAWICALHLELAASRTMLDEEHASLGAMNGDDNVYVFGRIAEHNVIMVALPEGYGKVKATAVSTDIKRSFRNIRATLMVGIGGGAPLEADLYLGDVVVGTRSMEYDLGKAVHDGKFNCTETPKQPSALLRSAVANLRSKHGMDRFSLRSQELVRTKAVRYRRPEQRDRLFKADYPHPHDAPTCDKCDETKLELRTARPNNDFWIHYGVVASGDSVIKDSQKRNKVSRELQALCFEMEAAGIMDKLDCLPIRGICDYSDSHKNKKWQNYAAATAAAYARELLETIPALVGKHTRPILRDHATVRISPSTDAKLAERREACLELFEFPQINARKDAIRAEQGKTCRWFLAHPKYQEWIDLSTKETCSRGLLWIRGKAGAGKSTLMKFLYSEVKKKKCDSATTVASFFFNARGEYLERSIVGMYRSLLKQILTQIPYLQCVLDHMEVSITDHPSNPSLNVLKDLFRDTIMALGQNSLLCFVDALDECDENDVRDMVQFFEELTDSADEEMIQFRVCFSSRPYPYIQVDEEHLLTLENEAGHAEDLEKYVRKCLKAPKKLQAELRDEILRKASGVFLWVVLVVGILNKETSDGAQGLKKKLSKIPKSLSQLFRDILKRDERRPKQLQRCILWVLCAIRPLTSAEFCHAMWAAGLEDGDVDDELPDAEDEDTKMALVTSSSKGLAEITNAKKKGSRVQFIHESVRDYLIKERGIQELWPDLGFEWEGPSHEFLRGCCESYLMSPAVKAAITTSRTSRVTAEEASVGGEMGNDNSETTRPDNVSATSDNMVDEDIPDAERTPPKVFAFLGYASQFILEHANKAAVSVPQQKFVSRFFLELGTATLDCCQPFEIRRYGPTATPTYIMADKGLTNLLRLTLDADPSMAHDCALRFQHPIFAAIANRHADAVALLLGLPSIIYEGESLIQGLGRMSDVRYFTKLSPLSWACQEGRVNLVKALTHNRETLTRQDPDRRTPLERTPYKNEADITRFFLDQGLGTSNTDYAEVIERAFADGHYRVARMLLKEFIGWDKMPTTQTPNHSLWLREVASLGYEDSVQLFIRKGAKVGRYPSVLVDPARKGYLNIVRIILDKSASLEERHRGQTALLCASRNGDREMVQLLLDRGADLHATDDEGGTALMLASGNGQMAMAQLLLDRGADLYIKRDGKTALDIASEKGHEAIVQLLLDHGVDLHRRDRGLGANALFCASGSGHEAVVQLLLQRGADLHFERYEGCRTALMIASEYGHLACVKLLLDREASLDFVDKRSWKGRTALMMASISGREAVVQLLLQRGADLHAKDNFGGTALIQASGAGCTKILQMLLDHGADLDIQDCNGKTALMHACEHRRKSSVQLILDHRANLHVKCNRGKTALQYAQFQRHEEVIEMLQKALRDDGVDISS